MLHVDSVVQYYLHEFGFSISSCHYNRQPLYIVSQISDTVFLDCLNLKFK